MDPTTGRPAPPALVIGQQVGVHSSESKDLESEPLSPVSEQTPTKGSPPGASVTLEPIQDTSLDVDGGSDANAVPQFRREPSHSLRWRASEDSPGSVEAVINEGLLNVERPFWEMTVKDWRHWLRAALDLYPYDDDRLPVRTYVRHGLAVSVLASLLAMGFMIVTAISGYSRFNSDSVVISKVLKKNDPALVAPMNNINSTNGMATTFAANMVVDGKPFYNESFFRVRFYQRIIYDGDYNRRLPCTSDAECKARPSSGATCTSEGICNSRSPHRDLGLKTVRIHGVNKNAPTESTFIQGEYGNPIYSFIYVQGELCSVYCVNSTSRYATDTPSPSTMPCSQCATDAELAAVTQRAIGLSLYLRGYEGEGLPVETTRCIASTRAETPKMET